MLNCTDAQMHKCHNAQMLNHVHMLTRSNAQLHRCTNAQVKKGNDFVVCVGFRRCHTTSRRCHTDATNRSCLHANTNGTSQSLQRHAIVLHATYMPMTQYPITAHKDGGHNTVTSVKFDCKWRRPFWVPKAMPIGKWNTKAKAKAKAKTKSKGKAKGWGWQTDVRDDDNEKQDEKVNHLWRCTADCARDDAQLRLEVHVVQQPNQEKHDVCDVQRVVAGYPVHVSATTTPRNANSTMTSSCKEKRNLHWDSTTFCWFLLIECVAAFGICIGTCIGTCICICIGACIGTCIGTTPHHPNKQTNKQSHTAAHINPKRQKGRKGFGSPFFRKFATNAQWHDRFDRKS